MASVKLRPRALPLLAAGVVLASCLDPETESWREYTDPEDTDYAEQRRERMNLRVLVPDGAGGEREETSSAEDMAEAFAAECDAVAEFDSKLPVPQIVCAGQSVHGDVTSCLAEVCLTLKALCVSRLLSRIATAADATSLRQPFTDTSDPQNMFRSVEIPYRIPPQRTEANAALAEAAFDYAARAAVLAGENLRTMQGDPAATVVNPSCDASTSGNSYPHATADGTLVAVPARTRMADALVESLHAGREAATLAAKFNAGAADAEFSRTRSIDRASKFSWAGEVLSRARAGHVLYGGSWTSGLPAFNLEGICALPELSDTGQAALTLLRQSGVQPSLITSGTALSTLIEGAGGVRAPLDQMFPDRGLGALDTAAFLAAFDLDEEAMAEARGYFAAEMAAFGRLETDRNGAALLAPAFELTGGAIAAPRYAATVNPPRRRPASYHLAQLFQGTPLAAVNDAADIPMASPSELVRPGPSYAGASLAGLNDYVTSIVRDGALNNSFSDILPNGPAPRNIFGPMTAVLSETRPHRVEACYRFQSGVHRMRVRVFGDGDRKQYRLVRDLEGLSCAVQGDVEGAACSLTAGTNPLTFSVGTAASSQVVTQSGVGFGHYFEWSDINITNLPTTGVLYLVRQIDTSAPTTAEPGRFEDVSFVLYDKFDTTTGSDWANCRLYPVVPEVAREASEWVTPSADDCRLPATSCAGLPIDQKIPLENELSEDGDAFESSWRHYLRLARAAADQADLLGQEVISRGLENDQRIEASINELESICGGPLRVDDMVRPPAPTQITCDPAVASSCPPFHVCVAGQGTTRCVHHAMGILDANRQTDVTARRLWDCIGPESTYPLATLGTTPLCVWKHQTTGDQVCAGATNDNRCPWLAADDGTCPTAGSMPAGPSVPPGFAAELVPASLGIVNTDIEEDLSTPPPQPPCDLMRTLRDPATPQALRTEWVGRILTGHPFFALERMEKVARRLGWEARIFDHSAVLVDGRPWRSTGDPLRSGTRPSRWPCELPYALGTPLQCPAWAGDPELNPSLMCSYARCGSGASPPSESVARLSRARMNQRIGRAVVALRLATDTGLENVHGAYGRVAGNRRLFYNGSNIDGFDGATWLPLLTSDGVRYHYAGRDKDRGGLAYCSDTVASHTLWTDLGADLVSPELILSGRCEDGSERRYFLVRDWKTFPAGSTPSETNLLWSGMGGTAATSSDGGASLGAETRYVRVLGGLVREDQEMAYPSAEFQGDTFFEWESGGNAIRFAPSELNARALLDGFELACEVARKDFDEGGNCYDDTAPDVNGIGDIREVESYLKCVSDDFYRLAQRQLVPHVPRSLANYESAPVATGTGEVAAATEEFRAALLELETGPRQMATMLRALANQIEELRLALGRSEIRQELAQKQMLSTLSSQMSACAAAAAGGITLNPLQGASAGAQSGAVCANTLVQIGLAVQVRDLTHELESSEQQSALLRLESQIDETVSAVGGLARNWQASASRLSAAALRLETARERGRRLLADALMLDSDSTGRQLAVNTVRRRSFNTAQVRYERAKEHAIRMAFLAKRALEQRLGHRLSELTEDMSLVEAPAKWEASVCTISGLDYQRVRDATELPVDHYADEFVGAYVDKLEQVVESYRLDFPFQDGEDTMVVSLRDDVANVRAPCEVASHNLLGEAGSLEVRYAVAGGELDADETGATASDAFWLPRGCLNDVEGNPDGCVVARPFGGLSLTDPLLEPAGDEVAPRALPEFGSPRPYRVTFGAGAAGVSTVTADARLAQDVWLPAGTYMLSWYGRGVGGTPPIEPSAAGQAWLDGTAVTRVRSGTVIGTAGTEWDRFYFIFEVDAAASYEVGIKGTGAAAVQSVDVAGLMLEDVSVGLDSLPVTALEPREFIDTDARGISVLPACEDTDGTTFRGQWSTICESRCRPSSATCEGTSECFHEFSFPVSLRDVDRNLLLSRTGFAKGNYNYRVDTIAMNVVGTSVVDCAGTAFPSSCYNRGFVPFSAIHAGPFTVRNHHGEDGFDAPLFNGRIQSGRALVAERYLGSPLSSTDQGLLTTFWHREFRGRPLSGHYTVRLLDAPGFNFDRVEDVQLLVKYRYWTPVD